MTTPNDTDQQLDDWEEYTDGEVCDDAADLLIGDLQCIAEGRGLKFAVFCLSPSQVVYTADKLRAFQTEGDGDSDAGRRQKITELLKLLDDRRLSSGEDEADGICSNRFEDAIDGSNDHATGGILDQHLPAGGFRVKDLSDVDDVPTESLRILNALAHIDLELLTNGIKKLSCSRWKKACKVSDAGVFGVPLKTLLEVDQSRDSWNKGRKVPLVVEQLIDYIRENGLHEKGILRVEGTNSRIRELRQQINHDGQFLPNSATNPVNPDQDSLTPDPPDITPSFSVHDVASVLKQLIRQLPTPLLCVKGEHWRAPINPATVFTLANSLASECDRLKAFNLLMLMLPEVNRCTFRMLLQLLGDVVAMEKENRMNIDGVARVFAPNIFLMACKDQEKALLENDAVVNCVVFMLKNKDRMWTVSASLQRQLETPKLQTADPRTEAVLEKALQSPD